MGGGGGAGGGVGIGSGTGLGGLGIGSWFRFDPLVPCMTILRSEGWRCDDDIVHTLPYGEWFLHRTGCEFIWGRNAGSARGEVLFPRHEVGRMHEPGRWIQDVMRISEAYLPQDMT